MKFNFNKLAAEYTENKYCIVKDAITEEELGQINSFYETQTKYDNGRHLELKLGGIKQNFHNSIPSNLFRKISNIRVKILSMASHSMIHRNLIEGSSNEEWEKLMVEVMDKYGGWSRFMQYLSGHKFHSHHDAKGEVMAILYLSQPLKDYTGGLYIYNPKHKCEECIDDLINRRDLLLCDANYYRHRVDIKPITSVGRLTYFINFNPNSTDGAIDY